MKLEGRAVFLVGVWGCGKTTVGQLLAGGIGRPFVDMDERIVEECGATLSELFAVEGEESFRQREAQLLDRLLTPSAELAVLPAHHARLRKPT